MLLLQRYLNVYSLSVMGLRNYTNLFRQFAHARERSVGSDIEKTASRSVLLLRGKLAMFTNVIVTLGSIKALRNYFQLSIPVRIAIVLCVISVRFGVYLLWPRRKHINGKNEQEGASTRARSTQAN